MVGALDAARRLSPEKSTPNDAGRIHREGLPHCCL